MTWTKLSDDALDRPEMLQLQRGVRLLLIELMCWSNRHLTDGLVRPNELHRITDEKYAKAAAVKLVSAGFLIEVDEGWRINNWSDQPSKEEVKAAQQEWQIRSTRSRNHRKDHHSMCLPSYCNKAKQHLEGDHEECKPTWCDVTSRVTHA